MTNTENAAPSKRLGGVADYFAILGVGEKLVWKHTQKKTGAVQTLSENSDEHEDDAALLHRFYREIVEVSIFVVTPKTNETTTRKVPGRPLSFDDASLTSHNSAVSSSKNRSFIQPSPTNSDATSTVSTSEAAAGNNSSLYPTAPQKGGQVEGFTIVKTTCPAGRGSEMMDPSTLHSVSTGGYISVNDSIVSTNSLDIETKSTPLSEAWSKSQTFDANLDPVSGLRQEIISASSFTDADSKRKADAAPLRGFGRKMGSTIRNLVQDGFKDQPPERSCESFHLGYRRRNPEERDQPAIADMVLRYVRIHRSTVCESLPMSSDEFAYKQQQGAGGGDHGSNRSESLKRGLATGATIAARVANTGKHKLMEKYKEILEKHRANTGLDIKTTASNGSEEQHRKHFFPSDDTLTALQHAQGAEAVFVPLEEFLTLPKGFTEWSIPTEYQLLRFPHPDRLNSPSNTRKTFLIPHGDSLGGLGYDASSPSSDTSGVGVEAYVDESALLDAPTPTSSTTRRAKEKNLQPIFVSDDAATMDAEAYIPRMVPERLPDVGNLDSMADFLYLPILALRRQRIGDEERFHEDPGVVDVAISFHDNGGVAVMPHDVVEDGDDELEEEDEGVFSLVGKTPWSCSGIPKTNQQRNAPYAAPITALPLQPLGAPALLVRRNLPHGFADAPFATRVLDRFPLKNYKGHPMPEEELPMFCYPTGCRLHRAPFSDCPLAQYYGFIVKNERGDSIHVSCVSFMEPLPSTKIKQLNEISERRSRTSLPHRQFCQNRRRPRAQQQSPNSRNTPSTVSDLRSNEEAGVQSTSTTFHSDYSDLDGSENFLLTGFNEMTTFENKTICLISRYPFWTAFRRFLSHLHLMAGSPSDLPIERWISHLLLSVPVPKHAGPCIIVPLPTLTGASGGGMVLEQPASKDLPIVDLPFSRLLACLDVASIVTIVLGLLALERKVIVLSTRPSLVLDGCELLRQLLFPFELCAPYVPRLTQPFMSCLDFPGAIFVGIHDDGSKDGLAAKVRTDLPEDSIVVDLDTGEIDCSGDRYEVLKQCWGIMPAGPRSMLVSEIETLCRDAGIVPGQEPLDSQIDPAFDAPVSSPMVEDFDEAVGPVRQPFDDRALRDSFLRFFCAVLRGYEGYLVVPDADFLISGNEWFDAQGFLSSVRQDNAPYIGSLVTTQLFQSFIQRRTEASDVLCLLFDECLAEYLSSSVPYGRLGGDVETITTKEDGQQRMLYSLLVDQCASEPYPYESSEVGKNRDETTKADGSDADSKPYNLANEISRTDSYKGDMSFSSLIRESDSFALNTFGDIVTTPSRLGLEDCRFLYCVDGNPCFPQKMNAEFFLPREPESMLVEVSESINDPSLTRSDNEIDEANRMRRKVTSYRGLNNQRRCMWQLPKLMGSHFLGSWLMAVPSQVAQSHLSQDQQSRYLVRALGAMRLLRNRHRIVADEAAYRALMVACGRTRSDRRVELVKLFGLLRSDGIFPSAVTLGQYTTSIAAGFSKRSTGKPDDAQTDIGSSVVGKDTSTVDQSIDALDSNLEILEMSGRRWRQRDSHEQKRRVPQKPWVPFTFTSSFVPETDVNESGKNQEIQMEDVQFTALWSRTVTCSSCSYIPLDEEIQGGWDVVDVDTAGAVSCPRCGALLIPKIGYRVMSGAEALGIDAQTDFVDPSSRQSLTEASLRKKLESEHFQHFAPTSTSFDTASSIAINDRGKHNFPIRNDRTSEHNSNDQWNVDSKPKAAGFGKLPPQIQSTVDPNAREICDGAEVGFVTYMSPAMMRKTLERHVNERGEACLERETMKKIDPDVYYNFLWYCTRFSLPVSLPISVHGDRRPKHCCIFASWDKTVAERGCHTGAVAISDFLASKDTHGSTEGSTEQIDLVSRFNLQSLTQSDWDQDELAAVLVTLVEACDKRDFRPVVECLLRINKQRRQKFGLRSIDRQSSLDSGNSDVVNTEHELGATSLIELDCYRTCLYLAKYQCTTAFHVFFPAVAKPCKGYHFWCPTPPLPMFDRLYREAVKRTRAKEHVLVPLHDVSDVALGFRCVFGHII